MRYSPWFPSNFSIVLVLYRTRAQSHACSIALVNDVDMTPTCRRSNGTTEAPSIVLLNRIAQCSLAVGGTRSRNKKVAYLSACLRALSTEEIPIGVAFLSGRMRQGRIGLGYATVMKNRPGEAAGEPSLTLREVDAVLSDIQAVAGKGSTKARIALYGRLLRRATADEQELLMRLLVGEVRQGALEGVLVEAVADAAEVPAADVRRAHMLSGDLGAVAASALTEGAAGLSDFRLELFRPLKPMLAQTSDDPADALAQVASGGEAALDFKIDGARVQVHKAGDVVRVYTRHLKEVTHAVPEVVEAAAAFPSRELILDGEVIALRGDGRPHPFQTTMRRFGRKLDVGRMRTELPITPFFFDILYADGVTLIDRSGRDRFGRMADLLPETVRVPQLVTADPQAADAFLADALDEGHEGIMAKSLGAPYAAGNRGAEWLKIKPAHTLDLVVLAADWGHGRRRGWLSNLHLGARNPDGSFTMLGKTFKGMTDEMLRWQTEKFQQIALGESEHTVHLRPEIVVEIAVSDIQTSPKYPGGLALRLARVKRYRTDKRPEEADTMDTVRQIHAGLQKRR
jgi:DNA ligase-1